MDAERRLDLLERLQGLWERRVPLAGAAGSGVRDELPEIEAALGRAADGVYGVCIACRNDIAPERLELLPATPYCRTCAVEVAHGPEPTAPHPTVPFGHVRGEQVGLVTDAELGDLLIELLRRRHPSSGAGSTRG